jgi:hypothetical protein
MSNTPDLAPIRDQLGALTAIARERRLAAAPDFAGAVGGTDFDFMTPEERELRHQLLMQFPTFAEDRAAAQQRIAARIAGRQRGAKLGSIVEENLR